MKCKEISELGSAYIDGEVSFLQKLEMKLHLLMCQHCRRYISQMTALVYKLRQFGSSPSVSINELDQIATSLSSLPEVDEQVAQIRS